MPRSSNDIVAHLIAHDCRECVVLSPHSDDAALSVPCGMTRVLDAGFALRVITCFSISANLTRTGVHTQAERQVDPADVTAIRQEEDRAFGRSLSGRVHLEWLDYRDAPLRGHRTLFHRQPLTAEDGACVAALQAELDARLTERSCLWAPLAIGSHVDHRIAHDAARAWTRTAPGAPLVLFYEDLPYASRLSPGTLASMVGAHAAERGAHAVALGTADAAWREVKRRAATCYPSQVSHEWLADIDRYAGCLREETGSAERVWLFLPSLVAASGRDAADVLRSRLDPSTHSTSEVSHGTRSRAAESRVVHVGRGGPGQQHERDLFGHVVGHRPVQLQHQLRRDRHDGVVVASGR